MLGKGLSNEVRIAFRKPELAGDLEQQTVLAEPWLPLRHSLPFR